MTDFIGVRFMVKRLLLCGVLLLSYLVASAMFSGNPVRANGWQSAGGNETPAERDARMKWWRQARFGMFIHWGLYAVPAGEYNGQRSKRIGEWIMDWANIPRAEYEKFATQFNPVKFDAREWVRIAKDA